MNSSAADGIHYSSIIQFAAVGSHLLFSLISPVFVRLIIWPASEL